MSDLSFKRVTVNFAGALLLGAALGASAQQYEATPVLDANTYLPAKLRSGPNHQVGRRITNDGYMNHYSIQTKFGIFDAQSNFELGIRVNEANALAAMESISTSDKFASAVAGAGGKVVEGAKNLVSDPVGTVKGTLSGVGALFRRAGQSLSEPASDSEDSALRRAIGVSKIKRDYAREFGVDVYSTNAVLQSRLDALADATSLGGLSAGAALMFVPGGAGVAVSVSKGTQMVNDADINRPPTDLRLMNRERLGAMGVNPDIIDLFMLNTVYSPTQQTLLVVALNKMNNTADRGVFIKFAIPTSDNDVALFRQRQAQMYAAYNSGVQPLRRFVPIGTFTAAEAADGTLLFIVPLDHMVWTQAMANIARAATASSKNAKARRLISLGSVSKTASASLRALGWEVQENAALVTIW